MKKRYDKAAMRAWIDAQPQRPSGGDVARQFGCCSVTGWVAVRKSKWDCHVLPAPAEQPTASPSREEFPLPRWCQPQRQRPRYRIDDHYPADQDNAL